MGLGWDHYWSHGSGPKHLFWFEIWERSSSSPGASRMTACWQHDSPATKSEHDRQVHQRLGNLVERRGTLFHIAGETSQLHISQVNCRVIWPGMTSCANPFAMPKRSTFETPPIFEKWRVSAKAYFSEILYGLREGQFSLHHVELSQMTSALGVLCTECWSKCIDFRKSPADK